MIIIMIKAIFWDNDGILVDTEDLYFKSNRDTFAELGIELTREEFIELSLIKGKGLWPFSERNGLSKTDFENFRIKRNILYGELTAQGNLMIEGAEDVLRAFSGRYLMGIVTSELRHFFEAIHRNTGILKYIDFVLAGGEYEQYKPHPAPYLKAIELSGCKPGECFAIEDSPRGVASAAAAGIRCIAIPRGITEGLDFSGAWKILSDISQLPQIIPGD
jgi:HAD superfamily hydrolase (TIGR01509 family)